MSLNNTSNYNNRNYNNKTSNSNKICNFCNKKGHLIQDCYKKNNNSSTTKKPFYKNKNKNKFIKNKTNNTTVENIKEALNTSIINTDNNIINYTNYISNNNSSNNNIIKQVLDSGASIHVCSNKSLFNKINNISNTSIKWGNTNKVIKASGIGDISLKFISTNKAIILNNVLYVPELEVNLLSLYSLVNKNCIINFNNKNSFIYKNNILLAKEDYYNKITIFETISNKALELNKIINYYNLHYNHNNINYINSTNSTINNIIDDNTLLLHKRFSYINNYTLTKLLINAEKINFKINSNLKELENCAICAQSKLTKKVNKKPITTIVEKEKLIYIDLGSLIISSSNLNYNYYITFLDYKTKFLTVDLLKSKKNLINYF